MLCEILGQRFLYLLIYLEIKMNKSFIASFIGMSMFCTSAMASSGEVSFFGNVSEMTCDLMVEVNGAVTGLVQLGTVNKNEKGSYIPFTLKAKNPENCKSITNNNTAEIAWAGAFNSEGLAAQSGSASDAVVHLKTLNGAVNSEQNVTVSNSTVHFDAEKVTQEGFRFGAALQGKDEVGDFRSAAAYVVTYK